jgi:hypothetical protein
VCREQYFSLDVVKQKAIADELARTPNDVLKRLDVRVLRAAHVRDAHHVRTGHASHETAVDAAIKYYLLNSLRSHALRHHIDGCSCLSSASVG